MPELGNALNGNFKSRDKHNANGQYDESLSLVFGVGGFGEQQQIMRIK